MFAHAKTRGLNIEDTRLTCARKLDLLMGLVTLALVWAERVAVDHFHTRAPGRKAHGYLAQSSFRVGFDRLRSLLRTNPHKASAAWRRLQPKTPKTQGVV